MVSRALPLPHPLLKVELGLFRDTNRGRGFAYAEKDWLIKFYWKFFRYVCRNYFDFFCASLFSSTHLYKTLSSLCVLAEAVHLFIRLLGWFFYVCNGRCNCCWKCLRDYEITGIANYSWRYKTYARCGDSGIICNCENVKNLGLIRWWPSSLVGRLMWVLKHQVT